MILAALPIFTASIALAWERRRPRSAWWIGVAVAIAGEYVLITGQGGAVDDRAASVTGDLVVLAGNLFASLGYVAGARLQQRDYPSIATTCWSAGIAAVALLPVVPFIVGSAAFAEVSLDAWLGVAYLAIGVTIVGYVLWYRALGKGGIARLALMQFLQPVFGVILAWVLLGERFGATFVAASAVVLLGVWIALRARY